MRTPVLVMFSSITWTGRKTLAAVMYSAMLVTCRTWAKLSYHSAAGLTGVSNTSLRTTEEDTMLVSNTVATMFASRLLMLALGTGGDAKYRARFAYEAQRSRKFHMRAAPGCGWRRAAKLEARARGNANVLRTQDEENIPPKYLSRAGKERMARVIAGALTRRTQDAARIAKFS
jgi:hypothetical protein